MADSLAACMLEAEGTESNKNVVKLPYLCYESSGFGFFFL